jgi:hypothetical protein
VQVRVLRVLRRRRSAARAVVAAQAGVPTTVTKLAAYHTSRGVPPRELIDRCRRICFLSSLQ